MKKTASEIINELEMRVARLERNASPNALADFIDFCMEYDLKEEGDLAKVNQIDFLKLIAKNKFGAKGLKLRNRQVMLTSFGEQVLNENMRVARLERNATTSRTALNIPVEIKSVQAGFRGLEDISFRNEDNRKVYLNTRSIKSLQKEILVSANKNLQNPDGFMEEIYDMADMWFNTRGYGPDHNAQEKFVEMAEEFVDDYLAD